MTPLHQLFIFIPCIVALCSPVLSSCGPSLSNANIPKQASEVNENDVSDTNYRHRSQLWKRLLEELKLRNEGSQSDFTAPSAFFDNTSAGKLLFAELTERLRNEHLNTTQRTACSEIVSYEKLGPAKQFLVLSLQNLDGAEWFLLQYKRANDAGAPDSLTSAALVSVPTSSGPFPVITYAHGGDDGLNQAELAVVFGDLQKTHIIVAPAFPGEGINGTSFTPSGASEPYTTDAEDLLAAHNCVVEPTTAGVSLADLRNKIKRSAAGESVSLSVGTSRGGLTSLIAHAKNAALISANRSEAKQFRCLATAINPTSFVYGDVRIYLEAVVRGFATSTSFYTLPTAPQLNDLFAPYRTPDSTLSASDAALEIQKRDATFNAHLIMSQLRNWSTNGKGAFLSMHATLDKKIPYTQGLIGAKILSEIGNRLAASGEAPGALMTTVGFVPQPPYSNDGGTTLEPPNTMHGDFAYLSSKARLTTALFDPITLISQPLSSGSFAYDKSPLEVLKTWLGDATNGCAAALD